MHLNLVHTGSGGERKSPGAGGADGAALAEPATRPPGAGRGGAGESREGALSPRRGVVCAGFLRGAGTARSAGRGEGSVAARMREWARSCKKVLGSKLLRSNSYKPATTPSTPSTRELGEREGILNNLVQTGYQKPSQNR
jgi:hypothetical protein